MANRHTSPCPVARALSREQAGLRFFGARLIARAAGVSAKTIHRRAARERWEKRMRFNRCEFVPPRRLLAKCRKLALGDRAGATSAPILSDAQRAALARASFRLGALSELDYLVRIGVGRERAAARVAAVFRFQSSPASLWRWQRHFAANGFSGLMDRKAGRVGRKPGKAGRRGSPK